MAEPKEVDTGKLELKIGKTLQDTYVLLNGVDISRWVVGLSLNVWAGSMTEVHIDLVPEAVILPDEIESIISIYRDQIEVEEVEDVGLLAESKKEAPM